MDIQTIFDHAIASDHEVHVTEIGGEAGRRPSRHLYDLGSMIVQFWNLVLASTVIQAIHQILDGADRDGAIDRYKSEYDYRVFQLVPVLQQLDAGDAQVILNTSRQAQTELKAGAIDIQAPYPQSELSTPGPSTSESVSGASPQPLRGIDVDGDHTARILELGQIAKDNPRQAIASATTLSISAPSPHGEPGALHPRAEALVAIAHIMMKKDASAAKDCVEETLKALEDIDPSGRWAGPRDYWTKAMDVAEELRDIDLADKLLRQGLGDAEKSEKQDEDSDDPNEALKARCLRHR